MGRRLSANTGHGLGATFPIMSLPEGHMSRLRTYLALMVVSAAVVFGIVYWDVSINDFPLDVPLPAKTGTFTLPPFSPSNTYGHSVQMRLNDSRPWNEILCETGAKDWTNHSGHCGGRTPDLDLEWSVSENGRVVATGSTTKTDYITSYKTNSGTFAERELGYFQGESGHTYQMAIALRGDPAKLAALKPRLQVQLGSTYGMGEGIAALVALFICGVAFLGALIGVVRALLRPRRPSPVSPA